MRADASFAVPVKLWALLCVFAGVTIGGNVLLTCSKRRIPCPGR